MGTTYGSIRRDHHPIVAGVDKTFRTHIGRHRWLTLAIYLAACSSLTDPPLPPSTEQMTALNAYTVWWNMVKNCSGISRPMSSLHWYRTGDTFMIALRATNPTADSVSVDLRSRLLPGPLFDWWLFGTWGGVSEQASFVDSSLVRFAPHETKQRVFDFRVGPPTSPETFLPAHTDRKSATA